MSSHKLGNVLLVLLQGVSLVIAVGEEWSYAGDYGVDEWSGMYPACGGRRQSPVDLTLTHPLQVGVFPPLVMNYGMPPMDMEMINMGHTVKVDLWSTYRLTGGPLQAECTYHPVQFHFHWGSVAKQGSEHTVKGDSYPLEMHIVHYDQKYASITVAKDKADGLAVIGVFFHISLEENKNLSSIMSGLSRVPHPGNATMIDLFPLIKLVPTTSNDYYFYMGSLTTPPCYQTVQWIVMKESIPISATQLEHFRSLYSMDGYRMEDNFRPVQPLNQRLVYVNSPLYSPAPTMET